MTAAASPETPKKTVTKAKSPKKSDVPATATPRATKKTATEPKAVKPTKAVKKSEAPVPEPASSSPAKKAAVTRKPVEQGDTPMLIFVTPEERHGMICNAAYYLAERRGFAGGDPFQDWVEAEKEVERLLGGSTSN